jgi:hypothetical protein
MSAAVTRRKRADPVLAARIAPRSAGQSVTASSAACARAEVLVDRRADGTIYLKSGRTLPPIPTS